MQSINMKYGRLTARERACKTKAWCRKQRRRRFQLPIFAQWMCVGSGRGEAAVRLKVRVRILTECCLNVTLLTVDRCFDNFYCRAFWIYATDFVHSHVSNQRRVDPLSAAERSGACWPLRALLYPRCESCPNASLLISLYAGNAVRRAKPRIKEPHAHASTPQVRGKGWQNEYKTIKREICGASAFVQLVRINSLTKKGAKQLLCGRPNKWESIFSTHPNTLDAVRPFELVPNPFCCIRSSRAVHRHRHLRGEQVHIVRCKTNLGKKQTFAINSERLFIFFSVLHSNTSGSIFRTNVHTLFSIEFGESVTKEMQTRQRKYMDWRDISGLSQNICWRISISGCVVACGTRRSTHFLSGECGGLIAFMTLWGYTGRPLIDDTCIVHLGTVSATSIGNLSYAL